MLDSQSELIELCQSENGESEEDKKEKDFKPKLDVYISTFYVSTSTVRFSYSVDFQSLLDSEITTPPPKFFLS